MPILKSITTPSGVPVTFHTPRTAHVDFAAGTAIAYVTSWPDESAYNDGKQFAWQWNEPVTLSGIDAIESALIGAGTFAGGSVVSDGALTLDGARIRKLAQMVEGRNSVLRSPLVTSYGTFDADPEAQENIQGTVLALRTKVALGEASASVGFTLANNSRVTITAAQITDVGLALFDRNAAAHQALAVLRGQIAAASTIADVQAITWPSGS